MLSSRTYGTVGLLIFSGECHCVAHDLSTLCPEIVCGETDVCFVKTPATTYLQRQISARSQMYRPPYYPVALAKLV